MSQRLVQLSELQPTDTIRPGPIAPFMSLTEEQLKLIGLPQVWETPIGLLISDGNNRAAAFAAKRCQFIEVDYIAPNEFNQIYGVDVADVMKQAEELRKKGIYSPIDLWSA